MQGYDTGCQPQRTLNEQRPAIGCATQRGWQTGTGTAGEVIRAQLCWPVLRTQRATPFSFQLAMNIYGPYTSLGELGSFYKEETSSSTPSKPDVLGHVSFMLCIQTPMTLLSCKLSPNTWKLEGVTWNPKIKNFVPWKSVKDFHGNSKNMVNSVSVNRHILTSFFFFSLCFISLCFKSHFYVLSGRRSAKSVALE